MIQEREENGILNADCNAQNRGLNLPYYMNWTPERPGFQALQQSSFLADVKIQETHSSEVSLAAATYCLEL